MSRIQKFLTIVAGVAVVFLLTVMPITQNQDAYAAKTPGGTETTFNWCPDPGATKNDIACLVVTVFNWLSAGVLVVVILGIVLGAVQYGSAHGAQEQAKKGIETMRNAGIALILYFVMWALLNFFVPGGIMWDATGQPNTDTSQNIQETYHVG